MVKFELVHARHRRLHEIRSRRLHGLDKRLVRIEAPPVALRHVKVPDAMIVAAVEIVSGRNAALGGGAHKLVQDGPVQSLPGNVPRTAGAVKLVGAALESELSDVSARLSNGYIQMGK